MVAETVQGDERRLPLNDPGLFSGGRRSSSLGEPLCYSVAGGYDMLPRNAEADSASALRGSMSYGQGLIPRIPLSLSDSAKCVVVRREVSCRM